MLQGYIQILMENSMTSNKFMFFVFILFVIITSMKDVIASEYKPRWSELPCQICIERPEEQGIINVRDVKLIVDDKESINLVGGQAACVYVQTGEHFIHAESPDPYDPNSKDPRGWVSNRVNFTLETGKIAEFEITKSFDAKGQQWVIKPAAK